MDLTEREQTFETKVQSSVQSRKNDHYSVFPRLIKDDPRYFN